MNETTLILSGGTVVCEHGILPDHDVIVRNGVIAAIRPSVGCLPRDADKQHFDTEEATRMLIESAQSIIDGAENGVGSAGLTVAEPIPRVVDARGSYVVPGLIDIHSDYIETIASPRPTSVMDLRTSLFEAERELVGHGVTTIFHSLSVYQNKIFDHKPIRNFENVAKLVEEIASLRNGEERTHLIRHRLHMRVELDSVDRYDVIKKYLNEGSVDLISFMDHTPGQGQYADLDMFERTLKGYREVADGELVNIIELQQASKKISLIQMSELARIARANGIAVASHDDDSLTKLDNMERVGTGISEFPITMDVARSARDRGMHALAGAPNVMMGHSHSGNLSAREAVKAGVIDVLCSDYYPAALLGAVFALNRVCGVDLAHAFNLVTINPARATGLDSEIGSIEVGKRADILLVREVDGCIPVVMQAFVAGNSVYRSDYPIFNEVHESVLTPLSIDHLASGKVGVL